MIIQFEQRGLKLGPVHVRILLSKFDQFWFFSPSHNLRRFSGSRIPGTRALQVQYYREARPVRTEFVFTSPRRRPYVFRTFRRGQDYIILWSTERFQ